MLHVGGEIYEDMNCMSAWKVIPHNALVALLDTVKTRVLNFCLEIEAEAPDAGEAPINSQPVPQERVSQVFNTYISGTVQNVATGGTGVNQQATWNAGIEDAMFSNMLAAVRNSSAERAQIEQMAVAIEELRAAPDRSTFASRYTRFMGVLADHMQVFGVVLAPYLPLLAAAATPG